MITLNIMLGLICICQAIGLGLSLAAFIEKRKLSQELSLKVDKAGKVLEQNAPFINTFMSNLFPQEAIKK